MEFYSTSENIRATISIEYDTHFSLFQKTVELAAREKERVGLYRQKTKAALVIQLAWRRYIRLKRHRETIEAQNRALQVHKKIALT